MIEIMLSKMDMVLLWMIIAVIVVLATVAITVWVQRNKRRKIAEAYMAAALRYVSPEDQ